MKRPSKEEIDRILDPTKIADLINKDGKLNTEVHYGSSNLELYLKYDLWEEDNALIILCGIDPHWKDRDIDFDDNRLVNIIRAYFFGRPITHDVPSKDEILGWIDECKEEHLEYLGTHGIVAPFGPLEYKWNKEVKTILNNLMMFEDLLGNKYFNIVWSLRSQHAMRLTRYRLLWKSGKHEDRNPPGYYIDWILKKGFKIPWLEWAKSKGLLSAEITESDSDISTEVTDTHDLKTTAGVYNYSDAFNVHPISIIAKIFKIDRDPAVNEKHWKKFAEKASTKGYEGLKDARASKGSGTAESKFNPYGVGLWLTTRKGGLDPEYINRKLRKNLPERSAHLCDETFV